MTMDLQLFSEYDIIIVMQEEQQAVLKEGGLEMKVKTVRPRAEGERWSATAIAELKDVSQRDRRSGRNARGMDFGAQGWHLVPRQGVCV